MLRTRGATPHRPHTSLCHIELSLSITTGMLKLTNKGRNKWLLPAQIHFIGGSAYPCPGGRAV